MPRIMLPDCVSIFFSHCVSVVLVYLSLVVLLYLILSIFYVTEYADDAFANFIMTILNAIVVFLWKFRSLVVPRSIS